MSQPARRTFIGFVTAYDKQDPAAETADVTLVIPEDLSALSDDDLQALTSTARETFRALYNDGKVSQDDLETLATITDGIEALDAEISTREAAAAERAARAAELAAKALPEDSEGAPSQDEDDETDDEADDEADETDDETDGNADDEGAAETVSASTDQPETLAASARKRSEVRVNLSGLQSRQAAAARSRSVGTPTTMRDVVMAAPDVPGFANGQGMDFLDIGKAVNSRLTSFNASTYERAAQAGRHLRQQFGIAAIRKPFAEDLMIQSADTEHVDAVFDRAADESRLPGGSLVASGGWCAPSETLYDLMDTGESRDGLFSVPEVGITRGGIKFTPGPDFATLYAEINGFHYTEQDDIDGNYNGAVGAEAHATGTPYAAGDVVLLGDAALRATVGGTSGGTAPTAPASEGGTVTDGTVTWQRIPADGGSKPCYRIDCPEFEEVRLDLDGLCLTAGLLQSRGYPEYIAKIIQGALVAHDHKMSARKINSIIGGSTAISMPANQVGATAPILTAIELQVEHYRDIHRLSRSASLEAVFPFWVRGVIRADLSRRLGVDLLEVTDQRIGAWFTARGLNTQFVYNWQGVSGGGVSAADFTSWPTSVEFLLYRAGTWVAGGSDVITLDTIYDSMLLGQNDYVALFTEEGTLMAKRGHDSRHVTVPICPDGATAAGVGIACDGSAAA